jgi:PAS domain S-box-containing protein
MVYRCSNDPTWTMEVVAGAALDITGYAPEALLGNTEVAFGDLVHPEDADWLWRKCQANLAARRACSNEYRIRTKSGDVRWVWDQAHGVYGDDGALLAIEGLVTDVTARKQLEEQLAQAQKLDGIGRLAGGIAHDFNNLLSVISVLAEHVLMTLPAGAPQREEVGEIQAASRRCAALIAQLLDFSRKRVTSPTVVELNAVVRGAESLLRRVVGGKVEVVTSVTAAGYVRADPHQLEQVLVNLAANARDAMPSGGTLTVETTDIDLAEDAARRLQSLAPGPYVVITVRDTGTGIAPDALPHIFEPFFTTKESGQGTGLGLAVVYGIVRQHDGGVWVDTEALRGTTFTVCLPRIDAAAP